MKSVNPPQQEFAVPISLLKQFQIDVRVKPEIPHANGWIIFDQEMLISVLRSKDAAKQMEIANQLEKMGQAGGEMIIMQR